MEEELINSLQDFFKNSIKGTFYEKDNTWEIITPFLDSHNDFIEIYLTKQGEQYKISDGGYIKFENNAKNIPIFIGTSRIKNEDEVYTLTTKDKIPNAIIDIITLIIIVTNQRLTNRMLTEALRERRN